MPTNVIMPALGVAQQTGTLLKWLKAEGQKVAKGEPLMEIETDKATVEIDAPGSGILTRVTAKPGDEVPVGQRIALILAPGEPLPSEQEVTPVQRQNTFSSPLPLGEGTGEGFRAAAVRTTSEETTIVSASRGVRILASPAAKRIAREKGVNLASVPGSGPEGSVLAADVLRAAPERASPASAAPTPGHVVPLSPMRRIVGERMTQSKQRAPHFYLSMDIDMSAVVDRRAERKRRPSEVVASMNDYILYACARALKDFPVINASFSDQGVKFHDDIHLGMAVALEEGLVVPVIRHADRLSLYELAARSRELVDRAQNKRLFPVDYEGGTFTVSNLGMLGVDSFTAIINPPQCAVLAVGRVAPHVVAEDGMYAIKPVMTATLSVDHRAADGAVAAKFLRHVKEDLEKGEF